jgi:hypothetical protein
MPSIGEAVEMGLSLDIVHSQPRRSAGAVEQAVSQGDVAVVLDLAERRMTRWT